MWRATSRMARAQVATRPLQSVLLAVVVGLAAATLTVALAVRAQASEPYDRVMRESNGAHLWAYSHDEQRLADLAAQPEVTGVSGPFPRKNGTVQVGADSLALSLWGMDTAMPDVGRPLLTSGRWLQQSAEPETVLEVGLARRLGLGPGDEVTVQTEGTSTTLRVVGVAILQQRVPYPTWTPGQALVLRETLEGLAGSPPDWEVGLRLADADETGVIARDAEPGAAPVAVIDWHSIRDEVAASSDVTVILFEVFSAFAIPAAALIIANVVGSQVLAQIRDVGILKAIGATPWQVASVFILAQLGVSVLAAIAGALLGFAVAPFLLGDLARALDAPRMPSVLPFILILVVAVVALVTATFAAIPAWGAGRVPVVRILRGSEPGGASSARLSRFALALRLPPVVAIGLKDAFARPLRAWFTIAAVALAVATAAMTLTIDATIRAGEDDPALFANEPYHVTVELPPETNLDAAGSLAETVTGVERVTRERSAFAAIPQLARRFRLTGVSGDVGAVRAVSKGRAPIAPGEVMVTENLARQAGVEMGDHIAVTLGLFSGGLTPAFRPVGSADLLVTGFYRDTDDDGFSAYTPLGTFDAIQGALPIGLGLLLDDTGASGSVTGALRSALPEDARVVDEVLRNREDLQQTARDIRPLLLGLNAMLLMSAVANMLATFLFAVRERYRDIGVLKAVGLTPSQVLLAVTIGAGSLAFIATLIGIPAGLFVSDRLFDFFGHDRGWKEGVAEFPAVWRLALLIPAALAVAVAGAWIPGRRAASLPVRDALRFE